MSLSANFLTELDKNQFAGNVVLKIGSTYFSQHAIDSGLAVDADKIGLILNVSINGVTLDLRDVKSPISTLDFSLLDKEGRISSFIGTSSNSLQTEQVELYFGFRTGSFDFSDYALLSTTRIKGIRKIQNGYRFSSREATDLLQAPLLNTVLTLDGAINANATTLTVNEAIDDLPSSGRIKIGDEFIQYAAKDNVLRELQSLSRGDLSSTADAHSDNEDIYIVTQKQAHAMDIVLDVILNDLGVDPALVDQTSFTTLRDNDFSGEDNFNLYIYNVEDGLKWLEDNIFIATNTRLITVNGVITIALLDQIPVNDNVEEIDERHIEGNVSWNINSDKIVNVVRIKWNYSEGLQRFGSTSEFKDNESISIYGERKPLVLEYKGVFNSSIVVDRATRLLARLSTPLAEIGVNTFFSRFKINAGDNTLLTYRYIPSQGGTLGFSDILEVLSRSVTGLTENARMSFTLVFSSYTGVRIGLIQPSDRCNLTVVDQRTVEVPDGTCYKVGYFIKLWDNVNGGYFSDPTNKIVEINGNFLTFRDDFITPLGANTSLYFAPYDQASGDQKARYAYIAPDTNIFVSDNSKAYEILV